MKTITFILHSLTMNNSSNLFFNTEVIILEIDRPRIIRISPFANRLSFDAPPPVQRLRCLANYQALKFSEPISSLGEALVSRMNKLSANNGGKYISVHLRFEEVSLDWMGFHFTGNGRRVVSSLTIFFYRIWLRSLAVYMTVGPKKN